ncbi:hypothetical protein VA7868_02066 [Vibrio aerogenes CECT 7868]|uniref:Ancillary SecYEG translocon subunit n=1 Tax=Vibrio aerogenes CECT 7868 TaxID=1216006 RepID=A0A1M5YX64_9VIBR|nr:YfgM family protein [Vibrio aerogenes]SHI16617.1 hypothetical protein VA7868_02066 [Vibrio aerogenes CECT 7868]
MELYDTEEQQVEAIKSWWQENGKAVLIGTAISIAGILGWNYYQESVKSSQEEASLQYTDTISALSDKGIEAGKVVQQFIDSHSDSDYSVLAAMQLAKVQVDAKQLDQALTQLEWAKTHTDDVALKMLLNYRIARIYADQGKYDQAQSALNNVSDKSWAGRVAELKGDIALKQGNKDAAYAAYSEAQQAQDQSRLLQMKLDDLAR